MIQIVDFSSESDKKRLYSTLKNLKPAIYSVNIMVDKETRSGNQSRYYWGVVVKIMSDYTGDRPEEMHEILKAKFLKSIVNFGGEDLVITKSTAKLNTKEFEDYLEEIRVFAIKELDVLIPMPNEYLEV